jgi:hypothetical protein
MVFCTVNGGTQKERLLTQEAFDFAIKTLMPRKRNLDVELWLKDMDEDDAEGYHCFVDKGEHNIELQKGLSEDDLITLVFHEMVHVKQHERNELKDHGIRKTWKGEEYITVFSTVDEYMSLPWEEEAYRLQEEMLIQWQNSKITKHLN